MQSAWTIDLVWWITVVELPALAGLLLLIWLNKRDMHDSMDALRQSLEDDVAQARERLASYKVEVATSYASIPALRDTESRLTAHLVRIEKKLDRLGYTQKGDN